MKTSGRRGVRGGSLSARLLLALTVILPPVATGWPEDQPVTALLGAFEAEVAVLRERVGDPRVREVLGLGERLNLMAVVAVGHPARTDQTSTRKELKELIVKEA